MYIVSLSGSTIPKIRITVHNGKMKRILLSDHTFDDAVSEAASMLSMGGVVLYPTDTLYGLGADAGSNTGVAKVQEIKGRSERKPIHAIVSDLEMARQYGAVPEIVETLLSELPYGKITFIVPKLEKYYSGILRGPTFGFRIPDNTFCIEMVRAFGGPVTTTSANTAGERPERDVDGILAQLRSAPIDLVVDAGELSLSAPSTVLDLSGEMPRILREGAVKLTEIAPYLELS